MLSTIPTSHGLGWGLLGVAAFSLSVPLTRVAVATLDPVFVGAGRAVVAGLLAMTVLAVTRQPLPTTAQWRRLAVVALGVVAGFPLLTSFALQQVPATHGAVVIALLPVTTAVVAVLRGRERPGPRFWVAAVMGAAAGLGFAALQGGGSVGAGHVADGLLAAAVVAAAIGYAEGGLLSRELGSWQTICLALVLAWPVMTVLAAVSTGGSLPSSTPQGWASLGYLSVISMFLGFFAWYRGLAIGPMTRVSQVQLVQPVLSIAWSVLLLGELLTGRTVVGALAVVGCAAVVLRSRGTAAAQPVYRSM